MTVLKNICNIVMAISVFSLKSLYAYDFKYFYPEYFFNEIIITSEEDFKNQIRVYFINLIEVLNSNIDTNYSVIDCINIIRESASSDVSLIEYETTINQAVNMFYPIIKDDLEYGIVPPHMSIKHKIPFNGIDMIFKPHKIKQSLYHKKEAFEKLAKAVEYNIKDPNYDPDFYLGIAELLISALFAAASAECPALGYISLGLGADGVRRCIASENKLEGIETPIYYENNQ